jgi:hypothetical protein
VKPILEKNRYVVISFSLEVHSKDEQSTIGGSFVLEEGGVIKEKENLMDKDEMETWNGEPFEDT